MFGLFDIPAWFVWALGSALQQVAVLFSSHAFKVLMQGREPTLATDVLVKRPRRFVNAESREAKDGRLRITVITSAIAADVEAKSLRLFARR